MKSYRKELWFNIPTRRGFVNLTPQIETCLHESDIQEGLLLCNAMHITASVFINADAHLKRQVMGREMIVAIINGKLDFGPREQIF